MQPSWFHATYHVMGPIFQRHLLFLKRKSCAGQVMSHQQSLHHATTCGPLGRKELMSKETSVLLFPSTPQASAPCLTPGEHSVVLKHERRRFIASLGIELHFGWGLSYLSPKQSSP